LNKPAAYVRNSALTRNQLKLCYLGFDRKGKKIHEEVEEEAMEELRNESPKPSFNNFD
jgi:hypothetical protein